MSAPFTKLVTPIHQLSLVCRGCLAESGEMKNMAEWGVLDDYFTIADIEASRQEGVSELLCSQCEAVMTTCKEFRERCQMSDRLLKSSLALKPKKKDQKKKVNEIKCQLEEKKLTIQITAPKTDLQIILPCPYHCKERFYKKTDLYSHLKKIHTVPDTFEIDLQYYCSENECIYHISAAKKKWFSGRKFLNQHFNKVHRTKTYFCNDCNSSFSTNSDLQRHMKCCNFVYICQMCDFNFNTNEKLMVHLKRKHPSIHQKYKNEKAAKRKLDTSNDAKKKKIGTMETKIPTETSVTEEITKETVTETWLFNEEQPKEGEIEIETIDMCDSPKKSFATQIPEENCDIKNDVPLPSWQSKAELETKTDEISTQVAFEDLLSLKSQNSEDALFFSESVSLSDIQTQTFPIEFGLSRSHKETQSLKNSQTQSPDLSIKETQTCFCHYDSPKPNFRLFDSLSSSPASINHTSAETQTGDARLSVKSDVMLSFNSAETQTCFDDSSEESI